MILEGKEFFALLNASLNGLCTVLLVIAYVFIRRKKYAAHGYFMSAAFLTSSAFLCSYLYSKYAYGEQSTASLGLPNGVLKVAYLVILIPHVILAVAMLPFILTALWRAYRRDWTRHTRVEHPGILDLALRQRHRRGRLPAALPRHPRRRRGAGDHAGVGFWRE